MSERTCMIPECSGKHRARGLCNRHYKRMAASPDGLPDIVREADGLRLTDWQKIDKRDDGCWIWTGSLDREGYGRTRWRGRGYNAHRYVWLRLRGPHAEGLELDHLCRVRACCNPDHLEPVTHQVNIDRGSKATATTCPSGHEYDTVVTRGNRTSRGCSTCIAAWSRAYQARKRASAA